MSSSVRILVCLGVRTRCHDGWVSCSLRDEALDSVLGDARADEAAVRARRIMGVCLLRLVVWLLGEVLVYWLVVLLRLEGIWIKTG
jgi:hypothetical protein